MNKKKKKKGEEEEKLCKCSTLFCAFLWLFETS